MIKQPRHPHLYCIRGLGSVFVHLNDYAHPLPFSSAQYILPLLPCSPATLTLRQISQVYVREYIHQFLICTTRGDMLGVGHWIYNPVATSLGEPAEVIGRLHTGLAVCLQPYMLVAARRICLFPPLDRLPPTAQPTHAQLQSYPRRSKSLPSIDNRRAG